MILTCRDRRRWESTAGTPSIADHYCRCRLIVSNIVIVSCSWNCIIIICTVAVIVIWRSWRCKRSWWKSIHVDRRRGWRSGRWTCSFVGILHVAHVFLKHFLTIQIFVPKIERVRLWHVSMKIYWFIRAAVWELIQQHDSYLSRECPWLITL